MPAFQYRYRPCNCLAPLRYIRIPSVYGLDLTIFNICSEYHSLTFAF